MHLEEKLLKIVQKYPNSNEIGEIARHLEVGYEFSLNECIEKLNGIWELKWSSSKAPFLKYSPFIDNLQILDINSSNGMNLLKPKRVNKIFGSAILAKLIQINEKRIGVEFTHAGLIGPKIGNYQIKGLAKINREQKGWLDITYLDNNIRICRGDKGTLFVLLKKNNIDLYEEFLDFNNSFKK